MEVLGMIALAVVALFVIAFLRHQSRMKSDSNYRHQVEQLVERKAFDKKAEELRRVAASSDNPHLRELVKSLVGEAETK